MRQSTFLAPVLCLRLAIALPVAALTAAPVAAATPSANIGFDTVTVADADGAPVEIGVWYPTDAPAASKALGGWTQVVAAGAPIAAGLHPLVVMSHGNGGWFAGHYDTAQALAHAGFVAAALTHPGDNYQDQSHATDMPARPRELSWLIGYMLDRSPVKMGVDPGRIGAFGFSSGGFTVLVAAGGQPDLALFAPHCRAHPGNFDCGLTRKAGKLDLTAPPPSAWVHDPRIKAVVSAAPALGFTFAGGGLKGVAVPVQLWRDAEDHVLTSPDYAEVVLKELPTPPDYHVVANADHFDFLAPCYPAMAAHVPEICASRPGFDRAAFHTAFDKAVVAFFVRTIG